MSLCEVLRCKVGASDEMKRKEVLQSIVMVKEQFLIEEVRVLTDDGSMVQASVPWDQLAECVKGVTGERRPDDRKPPSKLVTPLLTQQQQGQALTKAKDVKADKPKAAGLMTSSIGSITTRPV